MAGLTPLPLTRFRAQIGARGLSVEQLADRIERARSHVSQVLWGHRPSGDTWARIRAVVTDGEWDTLLQLEHCATWNSAQQAAGEAAVVWLMRTECAWCGDRIGFVPCCERQAGAVSHGMCPRCYASEMAQIEAIRPRAHLVATEAGA
jgi:hypothetical protein